MMMIKKHQLMTAALAGLFLSGATLAADQPHCDLYCYKDKTKCKTEAKPTKGICYKIEKNIDAKDDSGCGKVHNRDMEKDQYCFKDYPGRSSISAGVDLGTMLLDPNFENAYIQRQQDITDEQRANDNSGVVPFIIDDTRFITLD